MNAEEKFWEALRKLIERQEQSERETRALRESIEKLRKRQEKTDEQLRSTDEKIEKLRERQEKTDEQLRRTDEELRRIQKETHEEFKRIIHEMHISDKKLRERVEAVSDGYGRFVEGIVFPSALETFRKMGFKIEEASIRQGVFDDNRKVAEVDNWIRATFNGKKYIIAGEAKTTCTSDDVREHIERLQKIRKIPRYKEYKIIGFVSAVNYEKGVDNYILKNGLYLFRVSDNVMRLDVPEGFKPREY